MTSYGKTGKPVPPSYRTHHETAPRTVLSAEFKDAVGKRRKQLAAIRGSDISYLYDNAMERKERKNATSTGLEFLLTPQPPLEPSPRSPGKPSTGTGSRKLPPELAQFEGTGKADAKSLAQYIARAGALDFGSKSPPKGPWNSATTIPEEFHKYDNSPLECSALSDVLKKNLTTEKHLWSQRAFPSLAPSSRVEVLDLASVIDTMLSRLQKPYNDSQDDHDRVLHETGDEIMQELKIWDIAFNELIRQVYIHCNERGLLLNVIRNKIKVITSVFNDRVTRLSSQLAEEQEKAHHWEQQFTELQKKYQTEREDLDTKHQKFIAYLVNGEGTGGAPAGFDAQRNVVAIAKAAAAAVRAEENMRVVKEAQAKHAEAQLHHTNDEEQLDMDDGMLGDDLNGELTGETEALLRPPDGSTHGHPANYNELEKFDREKQFQRRRSSFAILSGGVWDKKRMARMFATVIRRSSTSQSHVSDNSNRASSPTNGAAPEPVSGTTLSSDINCPNCNRYLPLDFVQQIRNPQEATPPEPPPPEPEYAQFKFGDDGSASEDEGWISAVSLNTSVVKSATVHTAEPESSPTEEVVAGTTNALGGTTVSDFHLNLSMGALTVQTNSMHKSISSVSTQEDLPQDPMLYGDLFTHRPEMDEEDFAMNPDGTYSRSMQTREISIVAVTSRGVQTKLTMNNMDWLEIWLEKRAQDRANISKYSKMMKFQFGEMKEMQRQANAVKKKSMRQMNLEARQTKKQRSPSFTAATQMTQEPKEIDHPKALMALSSTVQEEEDFYELTSSPIRGNSMVTGTAQQGPSSPPAAGAEGQASEEEDFTSETEDSPAATPDQKTKRSSRSWGAADLPTTFVELMKKNSKGPDGVPKDVKKRSVKWAQTIIMDIYMSVDREELVKPDRTMTDIIYAFFFTKYGLKKMAHEYLASFLLSLKRYSKSNVRISMFNQWIGNSEFVGDRVDNKLFTLDSLLFYLTIIDTLKDTLNKSAIKQLEEGGFRMQRSIWESVLETVWTQHKGKEITDDYGIVLAEVSTAMASDGSIDFDSFAYLLLKGFGIAVWNVIKS